MAQDDLVGNMDTVFMIDYFKEKKLIPEINQDALHESLRIADEIFNL